MISHPHYVAPAHAMHPERPPLTPTAPRTLVVAGATGRLGRLLLPRLLRLGHRVRAISRHPVFEHVESLRHLQWYKADLADTHSLRAPLHGADAVFVLSPIGDTMDRLQTSLIDTAEQVGVPRVVKLSGSHWTMTPPSRTLAGALHHRIEARLTRYPGETAIIRPNAWAQALLANLADMLNRGDEIRSPYGEAAISFTDIGDIADMAVYLLTTTDPLPHAPVVMTGPQALSLADIAAYLSMRTGRPIHHRPLLRADYARRLQVSQLAPFVRHVKHQFAELIAQGEAAAITAATPRLLQRAARPVHPYLDRIVSLL